MNIKSNKYTRENLNEFGIFQLREIARSVGVHLPTTYKKDDLIEKILQVISGEIAPFVAKNKKGRPPKNFIGYEGSWSKQEMESSSSSTLSSWENGSFLKTIESQKFVDFGVRMPEIRFKYDFTMCEKRDETLVGVVFAEPNGWGTLHIGGISYLQDNNVAVISPNLMEYFMLKSGDIIEANFVKKDNIFVDNVLSINGKPFDEKPRVNFSNLGSIQTNQILPLWKDDNLRFTKLLAPIGLGQRVIISGDKGCVKDEILKSFAEEFDKNSVHTVFVALNKRPEERLSVSENVEYAFSEFDVIPFRQMYAVNLAIEQAKRLCESGKNVALVIDDILSVMRTYEYCLPASIDDNGFNGNAVVEIKKLLAVGRKTRAGGSVTLVAFMGDVKTEKEKVLFSMLSEFCNSHIVISRELFDAKAKSAVLPTSFTDNALSLLGEKEFKDAQKIRESSKDKSLFEISKIYDKYM